jgi:SIR2-like domain
VANIEDRTIVLADGLAAIPERLLLAHARGEVLFVAGAGVSQPSGLPDFRGLVELVYQKIDPAVHGVISQVPRSACNKWSVSVAGLTDQQSAEVRRFVAGDYDVVLGMLERRMDDVPGSKSTVRLAIADHLRKKTFRPSRLHRALMRLAVRGAATTIVTTNFEHLLQNAAGKFGIPQTYSLGGIPRPARGAEFAGVLHIHGALDRNPARSADLIVSDRDFGEFYLRRRVVSDFIYDAARLFHLVLVGYSANDAPMRYLLNAVAADGTRFSDLKERFTFIGTNAPDQIGLEDWKGRGITPIPYSVEDQHLALLRVLEAWAAISTINGKKGAVDSLVRRLTTRPRNRTTEVGRDLFDHLVRRGDTNERIRIASLISKRNADISWHDAMLAVAQEQGRARR